MANEGIVVGGIGAVCAAVSGIVIAAMGRRQPRAPKPDSAALTLEERKHLDAVTARILDRYATMLDECEARHQENLAKLEEQAAKIDELEAVTAAQERQIATLRLNIRELGGTP